MSASDLPTEEQARFDRSLRLWGAEAQKLLRDAHVGLIGCTAVGCEILKNMVLPGLGHFTIVDDAPVGAADYGANFFLEPSDAGHSKAAAACRVLSELNPLTSGKAIEKNPLEMIENDPQWVAAQGFTLIVASSLLPLPHVRTLASLFEGKGVPVVFAYTSGLLGLVRLQADPRYIIHTMPDPDLKIDDLRPIGPFPALLNFINRHDPRDDTREIESHSHIPWFAIVFHALKEWRAEAGVTDPRQIPSAPKDWKRVKDICISFIRKDAKAAQDNFKDAQAFCSGKLNVNNRNVPELKRILNDPRAVRPSQRDDYFWFLAHGLRRFKEETGEMPLSGDIPDFTATTPMYLELQGIFAAKGAEDAASVQAFVAAALTAAGRPAEEATLASVRDVTKHAWQLNYIEYTTIAGDWGAGSTVDPSALTNTTDYDASYQPKWADGLLWYIALRAQLAAAAKGGDLGAAAAALLPAAGSLALPLTAETVAPYLVEVARGGGLEIVTTASIVGAVAAQECIKLIQNRRVPIQHTLVYDGLKNVFTTLGAPH